MAHQPTQFQIPFDQIKPGMVIVAGNGFGCLAYGDNCIVMIDNKGLHVHCHKGNHYLNDVDGMLNNFALPLD